MDTHRFRFLFWSALLISLGIFFRVPLPVEHEINLALYDITVPLLLVFACGWGGVPIPRLRELVWPGALIAAIAAHATWIAVGVPPDPVGLARDSVRLTAVVIEVSLLLHMLRQPVLQTPPVAAVFLGFAVAGLFAFAEIYREGYVAGSYDALQTVHGSVLCSLLIVLAIGLWKGETVRPKVLWAAYALLLTLLVFMVAKLFILLALAAGLVLFLGLGPERRRESVRIILAAVAIALALLLAVRFFASEASPFAYMQTLEASLGPRLELWTLAGQAIAESFPKGLGAGQFGAYLTAQGATPGYTYAVLLLPHNTFLGLIVEFGLLGVLADLGLLWLVWRSASAWPGAIRLLVLLFLLLPMLLHDALGLRADHVIVALGLAALSIRQVQPGEDQPGENRRSVDQRAVDPRVPHQR